MGGLDMPERDRLIGGLGTGEVEILTSCDLISVGLDVPSVGAVILLRPTKSLVLFMQQCGRGMRPATGKRELIVLDLAANTLRHGLPDMERRWTLDGVERGMGAVPVRVCPECGAVNPIGAVECENCGEEFPRPPGRPRTVNEIADDLQEVNADQLRFYRMLLHIANERGYARGWAAHKHRERFGDWPSTRFAEPLEPDAATRSWVRSRQLSYAQFMQRETAL